MKEKWIAKTNHASWFRSEEVTDGQLSYVIT
ncbi:hypothetical protein T11_11665 [Trichinella zimbabwensis]|uniref:Uncharacterized protein n=1 Tax=Trichinella zimbabwensis TaxID=268475 RepID=A0A0V1H6V1_9BILA|nr:hypothetical protein T11_11665 [Trichinella zimbabwensis]